jgi:hypothetical protein
LEWFDSVWLAKELHSYRLSSKGLKVDSLKTSPSDEK